MSTKKNKEEKQELNEVTQDPLSLSIQLYLPPAFWNFCQMVKITPLALIQDFLLHVGGRISDVSSWPNYYMTRYLMHRGYGRKYAQYEIEQMLQELNSVMSIFPPANAVTAKNAGNYYEMQAKYFEAWRIKWDAKIQK